MSFSRSYTLFLKPPVPITLDINTYIYMLMLTSKPLLNFSMRESTVAELTTGFTANHRRKQIRVINNHVLQYIAKTYVLLLGLQSLVQDEQTD